jgi:nitrite reductase (NADH) small subunit
MTTPTEAGHWVAVCGVEDVIPNTGVCALVGGNQVAIFRVGEGARSTIHAIGNFDPCSKAYVLSRGIVGDRGGRLKVASPLYKQSFDLLTGQCLDDPAFSVPTFAVRVRAATIEVFDPNGGAETPFGPRMAPQS